jgi:hypothetical protein
MKTMSFFFILFFSVFSVINSLNAQESGLPLRKAFWSVPQEVCVFEVSFTERVKQGNFIALDWYNRPVTPYPLLCQISDAFGRQVQQTRYRLEETTLPVMADLVPGPYTVTLRNEQNDILGSCDFDIAIR